MPGNCAASHTGWDSRHDVLPGGNNGSLIVSTVPVRDQITTGSCPVTGDPIVEIHILATRARGTGNTNR